MRGRHFQSEDSWTRVVVPHCSCALPCPLARSQSSSMSIGTRFFSVGSMSFPFFRDRPRPLDCDREAERAWPWPQGPAGGFPTGGCMTGGMPMGGMPICGGMPMGGGIPMKGFIMPMGPIMPGGGMPMGGMPGMPMGGMPIIIGGMVIFGPVIARPLAMDMNFAEGLRYPERSHRSAIACWCGGRDRSCPEALSSRSLSLMYLLIASGVAPIMALPHALHMSVPPFILSF
mmetsp:Transcript_103006/g.317829  ORF Transcript_103006/g.317829 Transcript_103006/m.317829 type:complete len:230 (+) Transcript_103006:75-764(+)